MERTKSKTREQILLVKAKQEAEYNRLNISKSEEMFKEIKEIYHSSISEKYQAIYYFAATGNYSAEELAQIFGHKINNINADFNKNIGNYLKDYFELGDDERIGITSLRRLLFQKGFLLDINDIHSVNILNNHLDKNPQLAEKNSLSDRTSLY